MKRSIICSVIVTVIIPAIIVSLLSNQNNDMKGVQLVGTTDNITILENDTTDLVCEIALLTEDGVKSMDLEEYVLGVILGEMPVDFEPAALMAQAVVARTYACKSMNRSKHTIADVCTDSSCCQAYFPPALFIESGGSDTMVHKVTQAVQETKGQVLIYDGELIEATYFSCSGGRTEAAYAVWGGEVPYLQAVDSPGEETAKYYTDTVRFSIKEFTEKLSISGFLETNSWVSDITYTSGGGVEFITVNGRIFSGTEIRKQLNLRSTAFVISVVGETVTITTKGFGHRVGMSQYGAEAMALQGKSYQEILQHYYPGTELSSC